jgi:uncharacterized membrane protein YkoI
MRWRPLGPENLPHRRADMHRHATIVALICLAAITGIAVAGDEEKTSLDQIPAAAREALVKAAGDATITGVEREKKHGTVFYEGAWKVNGREKEAKVTADGLLVEIEEEVDAKNVPSSVQAVAAKEFPAGAKVEYEKKTMVVYEVEAKVDGQEKELIVSPVGKILMKKHEAKEDEDDDGDDGEHEEDLTMDQVPAAVKATIQAEAKGATIKEIERETENGQTVYEAEWVEGGQEVEIKIAPDGKLLKRKVEQEDEDDDDDAEG